MSLPSFLQGLPRKRLHDIFKKITGGTDIVDSDLDDALDGVDEDTIRRAMGDKEMPEHTPEGGAKGTVVVEKRVKAYQVAPLKVKQAPVGKGKTAPAPAKEKPEAKKADAVYSSKGKQSTQPPPQEPVASEDEKPGIVAPGTDESDAQRFARRKTTRDIGMTAIRQHINKMDYTPNLQRDTDLQGYLPRPAVLKALDMCFKLQHNLMLIGEAGSGKSTVGKYWAWLKSDRGQIPFPYLAISADGLMSVNQLFGSTQIKDGTSYYVEGAFTAFTQMPSLILIDEVTALDPTKNFVFHQILAERKFFVKEENHTFYLDPNCMVIFAGNPMNPRYPGVGKMNLAFGDRMATFVLEQMTIAEIRGLLKSYVDKKLVSQADLDKLMQYTDAVRGHIKTTPAIKAEFSMRSIRRFMDFLSVQIPPRQAIELAFINTYTAFDRATYDGLMLFTNNYYKP